MIVKQIRLSNRAKEQLIRLKSKTGIQQWNVLCRWALCLSLKEPTPPPDVEHPADSNVEMTWQVFGGEYQDIYEALIIERCISDGLGTSPDILAKQFRLHLHRGISYLAATNFIKNIGDLLKLSSSDETQSEE
ncbi:DNA sulfur modification protein DndE [Kyrpidia spormannii]|uniref:DNA sulfur modification protein DndE n=1 Tax=Kyrpidia spormannii TaxID=2055160 RepID=A0A2K8N551_9BACL|nr:DNA sulfur modification protein DndE [Kyrpidia spormannii]ATY84458.1 DNA sulfur modification protein DndE [Kyrpidia spormannii]